ncbi:hypothetical protein BDB00DRAFT_872921 [Zychaea mexicana]|uniref:uncharacterized protein n=1 Tax=Zychaea mexicana TaxID=64656 RepID=UPI0022FEDB6D|nr:uncharacterized protein BDB00DRAFT_872921 [Zychaea mexicana]KAI9492875.1 hypothetical protein BDB00DRAFT_872921 [Zychaea mexicana]
MRIAISTTLACVLVASSVANTDPMTRLQTQHSDLSPSKVSGVARFIPSLQQKTATTTVQPQFIKRLHRRRTRLLKARKEQPEEPEEIDDDEEKGGSHTATNGSGHGKFLEPTVHTTTDGPVRTVTQTGDKVIAGTAPRKNTLVRTTVSDLNRAATAGARSPRAGNTDDEAGDGTASDAVDEEEIGRPDSA